MDITTNDRWLILCDKNDISNNFNSNSELWIDIQLYTWSEIEREIKYNDSGYSVKY